MDAFLPGSSAPMPDPISPESLCTWLEGQYGPLVKMLVRHRFSVTDAEDAAQDAIFSALTRIKERTAVSIGNHESWLRSAALYTARTRLKRRSHNSLTFDPESPASERSETAVEARDLWQVVTESAGMLPADRLALLLLWAEGNSCHALGDMLGQSAASVRASINRARASLRRKLNVEIATRKRVKPAARATGK